MNRWATRLMLIIMLVVFALMFAQMQRTLRAMQEQQRQPAPASRR